MFQLATKTFPADAASLARLLNESIRDFFSIEGDPVALRDLTYPRLAEVRITLDGAQLRPNPPRSSAVAESTSPALEIAELHLSGDGISLGPAMVNVRLQAREVRLDQGQTDSGDIALLLQKASGGEVEISAARADLEKAIAAVVKREAGRHGVVVKQVKLLLQSRGSKGLDAEVQIESQKLFFNTTVAIAAKLDLDEQLNATISGVGCRGEGTIGSLACNFLGPHLSKINGRTFPLMAVPLGEIRLRDVRLSVTDKLTINAEFGA